MLINASLLVMFTKNCARSWCADDDGGIFLEGVVSEVTEWLKHSVEFNFAHECTIQHKEDMIYIYKNKFLQRTSKGAVRRHYRWLYSVLVLRNRTIYKL